MPSSAAARSPPTSSRAGRTSPSASPPPGRRRSRLINENPNEARKHLVKNTFTPDDVVDTVPMIRYFMAKDLTDKDKADYQKFIDFSVKTGTLTEKVDVTKYLQAF